MLTCRGITRHDDMTWSGVGSGKVGELFDMID